MHSTQRIRPYREYCFAGTLLFLIVLLFYGSGHGGISLRGSLVAWGGALLLFLLFKGQRGQNSVISFLSFHWLLFAYALVYPSPSSYFVVALLVLTRELIILLQNTQNQQTRASLLVRLGALPLRRHSRVSLLSSNAFAILSVLSALLVAHGAAFFSFLNHLPLLVFTGCLTHMVLHEEK